MSLPRLWTQFAASGLLWAAAAVAGGQEASPVPSPVPMPTAPVTDRPTADIEADASAGNAELPGLKEQGPESQPAEGTAAGAKDAPASGSATKEEGRPQNAADSSSPSAADKPAEKGDKSSRPNDPPKSRPDANKDKLQDLVEQAIVETSRRKLTAGVHTPWQIVHGILALRWDLSLHQKNSAADVNAIEWITSGVYHDGLPLWEATPYGGHGHPFTRPYAFEGHPTQFMGYMSMANIPLEYEVKTPTKIITIRDIINDAKMQVREGAEITWTLWALSHYEEPDAQWFNAYGEPWSIERLMRIQVDEPVTMGACGGCHGLFALAYARNMYISTGKPLRGVWLEADQKVKRYIEEARALQNPDGSFSSNHFKGPGYSEDFTTRIATSGHQLEWLMVALPQSKLKEEWVRRAINNVANDLIKNKHVSSDCGPLYHGVHSLVVYRQRTVPGYLMPKFNSHVRLSERQTFAAETNKAQTQTQPPMQRQEKVSDGRLRWRKPGTSIPSRTFEQPPPSAFNIVPSNSSRK